jgi:RNA-directed DNA polymerase
LDNQLSLFVRKHRNLIKAWQAVSANSRYSSSPYIKDEAKGFAGDEQRRIASIAARVNHGTFAFSPAKGVAITKPGKPGKIRPIVISRVEDRIVQRCILDALTSDPLISEHAFQPFSFGGIRKRAGDELAGVPAAISQLIQFVSAGASHVMIADIEGFFTKISKSASIGLIQRFSDDGPFLELLERAISVDLENARALWRHKEEFPYGDIGVAQGNCLSPFLGNLILSDFDRAMNQGDCRCIRYIDDIIIIAPSGRAASSRFRLASRLLCELGMNFAADKSSKLPIPISQPFEYLGIEFSAEGIRPSRKSRKSIVKRTEEAAAESLQMMRKAGEPETFDNRFSIPKTLNRISGMSKGWAHHYSFCNDYRTVQSVDELINAVYMSYIDKAQQVAASKKPRLAASILGYRGVEDVKFKPFSWPTPPPQPQPPPSAA